MGSIVRLLDTAERLDQRCYFCGEKRSVKYMVNGGVDSDGQLIEKEVPCCNRCLALHVFANDILEEK
mgnify:CR=1 FL=1